MNTFSKFPNLLEMLLKFALFCGLIHLSSQTEISHIEFFEDTNCSTSNGIVWETNKTLNSYPGYGDANSLKVRGLWKVTEGSADGLGWSQITVYDYSPEECQSRSMFESFTGVQKYGNSNLTASEIYLYSEKSLSGITFSINSTNDQVILPRPIVILSLFFSGVSEWSLYPNIDFTGNVTCVKPDTKIKSDGYGITLDWGTYLVIGSVRRGCIKDDDDHDHSGVSAYMTMSPNLMFIVAILHFILICLIKDK